MEPAAQCGDGRLRFEQGMRRNAPEGADDPRADRLDLPDQKRFTGRNLLRQRIPVPGRAALQDVADIDILPLQSHRGNDLREQLPCATDKRPSLGVFVRPRRLADKDQLRPGISLAEDEPVTESAERTAPAVAKLCNNRIQNGNFHPGTLHDRLRNGNLTPGTSDVRRRCMNGGRLEAHFYAG